MATKKKNNSSSKRHRRQSTVARRRNPLAQGEFKRVRGTRGNPLADGEFEAVWGVELGQEGAVAAKPEKRRRTTKPSPAVLPAPAPKADAAIDFKALDKLTDAELKALYRAEIGGKGRYPARKTMIKRLQEKNIPAAPVVKAVTPKTGKPSKAKPRVVKIVSSVAESVPSKPPSPASQYKKLTRKAEVNALPKPLSLQAIDKNRYFFIDANGVGYQFSGRTKGVLDWMDQQFVVATTSSDTLSAGDKKAIKALEDAVNEATGVPGKLVVVKTGDKPAPKTKTKPKAEAAEKSDADDFADMLDSLPLPSAGKPAAPAEEDPLAAAAALFAANPRRRRTRRTTRARRNGAHLVPFPAKVKTALAGRLRRFLPEATGDEINYMIPFIEKAVGMNKPKPGESKKEGLVRIVKTIDENAPKILQLARAQMAKEAQAAEDLSAPSAEDIVSTIQGVSISGDEESARALVRGASDATIKKVYAMLSSKGGAKKADTMRRSLGKYIDQQMKSYQSPKGEMDKPAPKTKPTPKTKPSGKLTDAQAKAEITELIKAKIVEMKGGKPAPKPKPKPRKPSGGGSSTGGQKKPKVSAEELAAGIDIDDILGNPRKRRRRSYRRTRR